MIKRVPVLVPFVLLCFYTSWSQVPMSVQVQILRSEDARRYDKTLEDLIKSPNPSIRLRAALAAGRIGDERAIPALVEILNNETTVSSAAMAAFAIGEIESMNGADAILKNLADTSIPSEVMARTVEAAGKIAAANPKNEKSKQLGVAILKTLEFESSKSSAPDTLVIRLGLTAALRARPDGAAETVRPFLAYSDPNIVADALNTLARLRAKNAKRDARDLLATNLNAIVRANAARVLGAAEDKDSEDVLIKAATGDSDQRVRASAIRTLGNLKIAGAADKLLERAERLFAQMSTDSFSFSRIKPPSKKPLRNPPEENELIEIAGTIGRLVAASENPAAIKFLSELRKAERFRSSEVEIALATVAPRYYFANEIRGLTAFRQADPLAASALFQGYGHIISLADKAEYKDIVQDTRFQLLKFVEGRYWNGDKPMSSLPIPELLKAFVADKQDQSGILREMLGQDEDVFIRATAAQLLADNSPSTAVRIALENAYKKALTTDKHDNDAQLAMLDAMSKINKSAALDTIYLTLDAPDYLVRKKAFELLDDPELLIKYPGVVNVVRDARARHRDNVLPYDPKTGTKLGQVLNTDTDYRRALSRKNGTVKAVVTTEKGIFTIDLLPEDAPLTVDNFVKLARSNYFNGLEVHRVVPNFVMQDGDPRGDGNGGPGWSIRCEINMVPYERGAVGMALSGKDTGGSQWFVTHSPQPHLDGGYTVFGKVNEAGMKVVVNIVRGDKIISIRIVEGGTKQQQRATQGRDQ